MSPRLVTAALLAFFVLTATAFAAPQRGRKATPFDGLRWNGDVPEVQVERAWYVPLSIEGVEVDDVLSFCEKRWPGQRNKRFAEDLAEAMQLMGHDLPAEVTLEVRRLSDGETVRLEGVSCTAKKRSLLQRSMRASADSQPAPAPMLLKPEQVEQDLVEFAARLTDQFAYLEWRGVDLGASLDRAREEIAAAGADGRGVPAPVLADVLERCLMRFGDGHARVECAVAPPPARVLPIALEIAGDGYVSVEPGRREFTNEGRPFVVAMDGKPIADWVEAVRPWIADGSEALVRQRAPYLLRDIGRARRALGLADSDELEVTFARDARGRGKARVTIPLTDRRVRMRPWLERETGWLEPESTKGIDGGVGYVRIPVMDDDLVPDLRRAMTEFEGAGGLIVDVRGNGGGRRGLLLALAGYLVDPDAPPVVGNVAAYRKSRRFDDDHLGGSRHLYRAKDAHWSKDERAAIEAFASTFEPEWELPEGFSEWHYLLLRPTGHAAEYHFTKPVVVLCDEACFSATDIFLGGLELLPNVTLVGRPSGGGSARSQGFTLGHSRIEVRCASMASFRPNGRMYDGRGVEVDVEVAREPGDLLRGGGDAQLEAAIERIGESSR